MSGCLERGGGVSWKTKKGVEGGEWLSRKREDVSRKTKGVEGALHCDIVCNKVIIRACIMDSEMPYFLV